MHIKINGESRHIPEGLTVEALLVDLDQNADRVAVECNREVVRRAAWPTTILKADDQVEIIHFVGGGFAMGDK